MRRLLELPDKLWLGLALSLRLGFALKLGDGLYQADENGYTAMAGLLARTGFFGAQRQAAIEPPATTAFIAVFYRVFGAHPVFARLGMAFLGVAAAYLVGRLVEDLTGSKKSGKLALILACVYPFFVYYSAMLTSETPYLLSATAGLWLLCRSIRDRSWTTAASAGAALGLAGLCRTEGVAIFAIIIACVFISADRRSSLAALICFAVPLGAWSARNHSYSGHFNLDEHGGRTILIGTMFFEQNEIDTANAVEAFQATEIWRSGSTLPPYEREKYFKNAAVSYMRENPGRTMGQWARKFVNFWRFYPRLDKTLSRVPGNDPAAGLGRSALVLISLLFEPALILGGLGGLWELRGRWKELFPLVLFVSGTAAVHTLVVSQMRYRLAVMPVLMLGLCSWLSRSSFFSGTTEA